MRINDIYYAGIMLHCIELQIQLYVSNNLYHGVNFLHQLVCHYSALLPYSLEAFKLMTDDMLERIPRKAICELKTLCYEDWLITLDT